MYGNSSSSTSRRCNMLRITMIVTALGTANRYAPALLGIAAWSTQSQVSWSQNSTYNTTRLYVYSKK